MLHPAFDGFSISPPIVYHGGIVTMTQPKRKYGLVSRSKERPSLLIYRHYFLILACISHRIAGNTRRLVRKINNLKGYLGLYLAQNDHAFLNGVKGFCEHLGLYLTWRECRLPLFSLPAPGLLIIRMLFSPRLDYLVPADPIIRILSAKTLVALALPDFPARRRARLLARPDPSVRREHPAATRTTLLIRHHHRPPEPMMAATLLTLTKKESLK